ncbi:hypothetical protein [Enterococcus faecium]
MVMHKNPSDKRALCQ